MNLSKQEIKQRLDLPAFLASRYGTIFKNGKGRCLFAELHNHGDINPSLALRKDKKAVKDMAGDHLNGWADCFQIVMLKEGKTFEEAKEICAAFIGLNGRRQRKSKGTIVATYDYTDEQGQLLFQTVRFLPKDFRQRRPDGNGGWHWNLEAVRLVLYRLPDVIKADVVLIVEGEKDVETAYRLGLPEGWAATTAPMGAGKWRDDYSDHLNGKRVVLLPDADEPGQKHIGQIVQALTGKAAEFRTATLPEGRKDLSEWAEAGGTAEQFHGLLKDATLSPSQLHSLVEQVNSIRLSDGLKTFEKKRAVAALVAGNLSGCGKFIRTRTNERYFFSQAEKMLEPLDSEEFRAMLFEKFGLNPSEEEARFVERDLETRTTRQGKRAEVHRLAWWDETAERLYVSANDGTMFVLDGETIKLIDNGTHEVLFLNDRRAEPIKPDLNANPEAFDCIFENLSLLEPQDDPEIKRRALALLKVWVLGLFFLEAMPVRAIVLLIGEQGAGKTTLGRRLGLVLYGAGFDVGSFRSDIAGEQDFLAAMTARRFVVFDNADARIKWLPDHLAKVATGAEIQRRKLYTTNDLITYRADCFLMLTSRDPKWKRDDVARRLLPIRMQTIKGEKSPEGLLQRRILKERNYIWGSLLNLLNGVVKKLKAEDQEFTSSHRLADFHWFGHLAASVLGSDTERVFEEAMDHLDEAQLELLGEGDDGLELLALWVANRGENWRGEEIKSGDLFDQLRGLHVGPERHFPFKNPTALGTWLGRHGDLIKVRTEYTIEPTFIGHIRGWVFSKAGCEGVKGNDSQGQPQENQGNAEFTPSHHTTNGKGVNPLNPLPRNGRVDTVTPSANSRCEGVNGANQRQNKENLFGNTFTPQEAEKDFEAEEVVDDVG